MKQLNAYILEKLHLNKNIDEQDEYIKAEGTTLDELEYWVHNDWDGESSFLIDKKVDSLIIDELIAYMEECDNNIEPGRAEYSTDKYKEYTLIKVELNEKN